MRLRYDTKIKSVQESSLNCLQFKDDETSSQKMKYSWKNFVLLKRYISQEIQCKQENVGEMFALFKQIQFAVNITLTSGTNIHNVIGTCANHFNE